MKRVFFLVAAAILAVAGAGSPVRADPLAHRAVQQANPPTEADSTAADLLMNGNMNVDDNNSLPEKYYWRPTNHFVTGYWYEWWVGNNLPEFIDGGIPHHNACYPEPAPGQLCHPGGYANSSQGYIRWGAVYIAGIYQPVSNVTPCTLYTFSAYNRNDADNYRAKVGINTTGWVRPIATYDNPPYNCPPTGTAKCPDPRFPQESDMPANTVWSTPSNHTAFTWKKLSVTAEAAANTISVWTYAAPQTDGSLSTYWDEATLVQAPFPNGRLPDPVSWTPSDFIYNLSTDVAVGPAIDVSWDTRAAGSTQIWYGVTSYQGGPVNVTPPYSYTSYLPMLMRDYSPYPSNTTLDTTPTTHHWGTITGLKSGDRVQLVVVSRRLVGDVCRTEVSAPVYIDIP